MKIIVQNSMNDFHEAVILKSTRYYARLLFQDNPKIKIFVKLRQPLGKGVYGFGGQTDDGKDYEILIRSNVGLKTQLRTIAHELAHIKQMVNKELVDRPDGWLWRKKFYKYNTNEHVKKANKRYWLSPWEIEARGIESGLFTMLVEQLDLKTKAGLKLIQMKSINTLSNIFDVRLPKNKLISVR